MTRLHGTRVFDGFAIGVIRILQRKQPDAVRKHVDDTGSEMARYNGAKERVKEDLSALRRETLARVDSEVADIFEVQRMMLDDPDFSGSVLDIIETERVNAEYAVRETGRMLAERFLSHKNVYMQARAQDITDLGNRLLLHLTGTETPDVLSGKIDTILVSDTLTPGDCIRLDPARVKGIVTRLGSVQSHTAILANAMEIPSMTGVDFDASIDGRYAVLDSHAGLLIIDPDEDTRMLYEKKIADESVLRASYLSLKGKENVTLDGKTIELSANIGGVNDVASALKNDAGGIGLFRSEFLFLASDTFPTEEEQFEAYKTVAERMEGKRVIIRTLDIGADKHVDYLPLAPEENPALGLRAIRICLEHPDLLRTQLRAILRATAFGNIAVMYPMITSVWEVRALKDLFEDVKAELEEEQIPVAAEIEQGIMIETPAAVLISEQLAQEADFFSIGTNDLTQYLLAADRQNPHLERYYDPQHPSVLWAIRHTVKNAHKYGKRVGICGELASDTTMTSYLLGLGIDELSLTPSRILAVRDAVRKTNLEESL